MWWRWRRRRWSGRSWRRRRYIAAPTPAARLLPEAPQRGRGGSEGRVACGRLPPDRAACAPSLLRRMSACSVRRCCNFRKVRSRQMVVEPNALPFATPGPRPPLRKFVAPAGKARAAASPAGLPAAPEVAALGASKGGLEKVPRGYEPRKAPAVPAAAPAISAEPPAAAAVAGGTAAATLAIVGLNPAKAIEVPAPPASRAAGFSAGPETRD